MDKLRASIKWWREVDDYIIGSGITISDNELIVIYHAKRAGLSPSAAVQSVLANREMAA